jgi:hypothetical protein
VYVSFNKAFIIGLYKSLDIGSWHEISLRAVEMDAKEIITATEN